MNRTKFIPIFTGGKASLIDERQLIQLQQEQAHQALEVPEGTVSPVDLGQ